MRQHPKYSNLINFGTSALNMAWLMYHMIQWNNFMGFYSSAANNKYTQNLVYTYAIYINISNQYHKIVMLIQLFFLFQMFRIYCWSMVLILIVWVIVPNILNTATKATTGKMTECPLWWSLCFLDGSQVQNVF